MMKTNQHSTAAVHFLASFTSQPLVHHWSDYMTPLCICHQPKWESSSHPHWCSFKNTMKTFLLDLLIIIKWAFNEVGDAAVHLHLCKNLFSPSLWRTLLLFYTNKLELKLKWHWPQTSGVELEPCSWSCWDVEPRRELSQPCPSSLLQCLRWNTGGIESDLMKTDSINCGRCWAGLLCNGVCGGLLWLLVVSVH